MKFTLSIIVLLILSYSIANSQTKDYKNAIYGNLGAVPVTFGTSTVNIERYLFSINKGVQGSVSLRLGYGTWGDWGGEGKTYLGTINFLTGSKKGHFEVGVGPVILREDDFEQIRILQPDGSEDFILEEKSSIQNRFGINAGYRYTSKFFLFRAGISWPETIYIGMGVTF